MKIKKSMAGCLVFLFLITMTLAACGSSKSGKSLSSRPYCKAGSTLGSCMVRKTYRRVLRLFPLD
ncbi:MAG: hypothetical protein HQM13_08865 [SAR324 cluster bacterium]|nr:hypothetical protein [SAR324 cluster bacterium]